MNHRLLVAFACLGLGCMFDMAGNAARGDELDNCISAAKKTNVRCWDKCDADADECIADCDADFETRKQQCRSGARADASAGQTGLSGTSKTGQGGCYYGECPADLDKKIENSEAEEAEPEEPPKKKPVRRQEPTRRQESSSTSPVFPTVQMTRICQTPTYWCTMNVPGPVNNACWCANAFGFANGITIPER